MEASPGQSSCCQSSPRKQASRARVKAVVDRLAHAHADLQQLQQAASSSTAGSDDRQHRRTGGSINALEADSGKEKERKKGATGTPGVMAAVRQGRAVRILFGQHRPFSSCSPQGDHMSCRNQ